MGRFVPCAPFVIAVATDLADQFFLGGWREVAHFLKIDGSTLASRGQYLFRDLSPLKDLKALRRAAGENMDARGRGRLARTAFGDDQYRHIILRQLADHGFDRAHAGAYAFEPDASVPVLGRSGSRRDFGLIEIHILYFTIYFTIFFTIFFTMRFAFSQPGFRGQDSGGTSWTLAYTV